MAVASDHAWLENSLTGLGIPGPFRNLRILSGGCINQAYALETGAGTVFVKASPAMPEDFFLREVEGLKALAETGAPLRIPRIWGHAATAAGSGILVLEYLEQARATDAQWEGLGRGLALLHRQSSDRFGFENDNYLGATPQMNGWTGVWGEFFALRRIEPLVRTLSGAGILSESSRQTYVKLVEKIPYRLCHNPRPALIHGDLWRGNFMVSTHGPALFDPAVYFGDREAEWALMKLFGGFPDSVFAAYEETNPLPHGWRDRLPLYQLHHLLNHQILFGEPYGSQALATARKFL